MSDNSHTWQALGANDVSLGSAATADSERRQNTSVAAAHGGRAPSAKNTMLLGGAALVICIFTFVAQTAITRQVQQSFTKPYFMLWVSHSFWALMLPLHTLYEQLKRNPRSLDALKSEALVATAMLVLQRRRKEDVPGSPAVSGYQPVETADAEIGRERRSSGIELGTEVAHLRTAFKSTDEVDGSAFGEENVAAAATAVDSNSRRGAAADTADAAAVLADERPWWLLWRAMLMALLLVAMLNAATYLWYVAVGLTSMSKVTAIYNTSCFFAYLFSVLLLNERVQAAKAAAVVVSIFGVVFMALVNVGPKTLSANESPHPAAEHGSELLGDVLSLVCACGTGLYQVLYKKYAVPRDYHSLYAVNFMTTLLGLTTLLVFWLPMPALHAAGVESFQWPNRSQFGLLVANGILAIAYYGGFMIALALTSPLFAAIGVMLTIPITAVVDMLIRRQVLPWNVFVGGAAILVGFCILFFAEYRDTVRKSQLRHPPRAS
ncbi:hypothetical protein H4S08_002129 [Coemansia sp. RSA 1365]|nr:hypothetical protein H4S08_002129 [Coemansia sp. RSA 1365]